MSSMTGNKIKISIFGESHGKAIGAVIDGLPAGEVIDTEELSRFLSRRQPGQNQYSTPRNETDLPIFLSGFHNGKTTGSPLCAVIENTNTRSKDYSELKNKPRPAHADFSAFVKYGGHADMRGGGHFSGRLTAPLCIAGGIAKQILSRRGIETGAHILSVGKIRDSLFDEISVSKPDFKRIYMCFPPVLSSEKGEEMLRAITKAAEDGDSIGGVVECAVTGLTAGIGEPIFNSVESRMASLFFSIPAVKGVEFGSGFNGSIKSGSENNDEFYLNGGEIKTRTNNHGGILGGITTGMPVIARVAFKPTPSIAKPQRTVDLKNMTETEIAINGRHDPCIVIRAVPVVEAAAAIAILDLLESAHHVHAEET